MQKLIDNISQNSILLINNQKYNVLAKAKYTMEKGGAYVKVFLENKYALVDFLDESGTLLFAKNYGAIIPAYPTPISFSFQGKPYHQVNRDMQRVAEVFFGGEGTFESDLEFIDYEVENDPTSFISIGYIATTGERVDLVGTFIPVSEIGRI